LAALVTNASTSAASRARRPYFLAISVRESGFPMSLFLMVNLRVMTVSLYNAD